MVVKMFLVLFIMLLIVVLIIFLIIGLVVSWLSDGILIVCVVIYNFSLIVVGFVMGVFW